MAYSRKAWQGTDSDQWKLHVPEMQKTVASVPQRKLTLGLSFMPDADATKSKTIRMLRTLLRLNVYYRKWIKKISIFHNNDMLDSEMRGTYAKVFI
jgi:hypothetical protein